MNSTEPLRLRRAALLHRFRDALARRHAPSLDVFRAGASCGLRCSTCLAATAASLRLKVERLEPLPEEAGVFEPYDFVSWGVHGGPDSRGDAPLADGKIVTHFEPAIPLGLFRVSSLEPRGDDLTYVWIHEWGKDDEHSIFVATRRRTSFERFVADLEERHVAHERSRPGLVVLGDYDERRARSETVSWEDVLLPLALRRDLERTVLEFFASRELYRRHGLSYRRGILLSGPPGNGKTTVLKAIRTSAGVPVILAIGMNVSGRTSLIEQAFDRAACLAPAVLCFEDLDALLEEGPALSLFLNLMDGLAPLEGVLVVATTNRPDRIDPAIAKRPSRFDRVYTLPAPERALRLRYFERMLGTDAPAGAAPRLAASTEGYSVAFLKEIVVQARFAALRRKEETVRDEDLDAALAETSEHVRLATRDLEARGSVGFTA